MSKSTCLGRACKREKEKALLGKRLVRALIKYLIWNVLKQPKLLVAYSTGKEGISVSSWTN